MRLAFACSKCGHKLTADVDNGGMAVECSNCSHLSVVPTAIERANRIADRIEDMLINKDYVPGTTFMRLSNTGASTRMEVRRALLVMTAQVFQATFRSAPSTDKRTQFDEFASATSSAAFQLNASVVPDSELSVICKLYRPNLRASIQGTNLSRDEKMERMQHMLDFVREEKRLQSLVMSDAAWNQSETVESFVAFLKALNPAADDYWSHVYHRIGLPCPLPEVPNEPIDHPAPAKPWWQR